jgi:hypothetical protein
VCVWMSVAPADFGRAGVSNSSSTLAVYSSRDTAGPETTAYYGERNVRACVRWLATATHRNRVAKNKAKGGVWLGFAAVVLVLPFLFFLTDLF